MYAHFSVYVFINCKQKPSIILNLKKNGAEGGTLRECKGNQLLFTELIGATCCVGCLMDVQWYIFVVRFWLHFVKLLRNVVFRLWNHIYSGQCGHSNAVCELFLFCLFFFLSLVLSFISQNRWKKNRKNNNFVNANIMTRKLTGVNPKTAREIFHNFTSIFKIHSLKARPGQANMEKNLKETIQHELLMYWWS